MHITLVVLVSLPGGWEGGGSKVGPPFFLNNKSVFLSNAQSRFAILWQFSYVLHTFARNYRGTPFGISSLSFGSNARGELRFLGGHCQLKKPSRVRDKDKGVAERNRRNSFFPVRVIALPARKINDFFTYLAHQNLIACAPSDLLYLNSRFSHIHCFLPFCCLYFSPARTTIPIKTNAGAAHNIFQPIVVQKAVEEGCLLFHLRNYLQNRRNKSTQIEDTARKETQHGSKTALKLSML